MTTYYKAIELTGRDGEHVDWIVVDENGKTIAEGFESEKAANDFINQ